MTVTGSASAPTNPEENLLQGRYRVTRCLGSGGMGDVYLAEDLRLHRLVAVKSLKQEFCKMPEVRKRIERECIMHAQLGAHPNVITLYDRIEADGQIHLIIEYIDGSTLKDLIDKARLGSVYMSWRESVSIACQILEALAKIHAQDIVHRDVKPANVMLTQSDTGAYTAKLMDFGIARLMNPVDGATMLTREGGSGPGTPIYMSPEQIAGTQFGPLSPATDVYAVGVVLFQMLAKRPPFHGTITDIFHGHLNAPPPPIDAPQDSTYPPQLTDVVHKALAKQSVNRYASAAEFRHALKRLTKATGTITTLAVAGTVGASGAESGATIPLTPAIVGPNTSSWFDRRVKRGKSASRTVIVISVVFAAIAAVLVGNFFFFRSLTRTDAPGNVPEQTVTGLVPLEPSAPNHQAIAPMPAQPDSTSGVNAAQANSSAPVTAERPTPVSIDEKPIREAETPTKAARESPIEPVAKPEVKKTVAKPMPVEPADVEPTPIITPLPPAPKNDPERTPVPRQTPIPPDISVPTAESESFSERARRPAQEMTPVPPQSDANIFKDVHVIKKPATKVN